MHMRLLGTVELVDDGGQIVQIPSPKRRLLLATLAIDVNRVVSVSRLLDVIWDGAPPAQARTALQGHISFLRKILTSNIRLETHSSGYMLTADRDAIDAHRYEDIVLRADAGDPQAAVGQLRSALELWRGPALADVQVNELQLVATALEDSRLAALEAMAGHLIALDRAHEVIPELTAAAHANPLRESLVRSLMLSLYSAGRQVEALTLYDATRRALVDSLGVDPSPQLQDAYQVVLRNEPMRANRTENANETSAPTRTVELPRLAQLPRQISGFVGRTEELGWLSEVAAGAIDGDRGVALIVGPAGVGKTSLVTRWATNAAKNYPDGQLFVNLHGFDDSDPLSTTTALNSVLRSLGTPDAGLPRGEEAQAALYRSIVSGRRLLVVLDNARSADQVRPLLPSGPGSVTLVTSRTRMEGLVVYEGASTLQLSPLPRKESVDLITGMVGHKRVAADISSVTRLADLCDRLPLALRIAGALMLTNPNRQVSDLISKLADEQQTLSTLSIANEGISIEASLSFTFRSLKPHAAGLFRLLGLHPGAEFDHQSCAALVGCTLAESQNSLNVLSAVHLLNQQHDRDEPRYHMHDLIRKYVRQLTTTELATGEREAAFARLVSYYVTLTGNARRILTGPTHPICEPDEEFAPANVPAFESAFAAVNWFGDEEPTIRALISQARRVGRHADAWRLMDNCLVLYITRGSNEHFIAAARAAVDAALESGDPLGQVLALRSLGSAYTEAYQIASAREYLQRALEIADKSPDTSSSAARGARILYLAALARSKPDEVIWDDDLVTGSEYPESPFYQAARLDYLSQVRLVTGRLAGTLALVEEAQAILDEHHLDSLRHRVMYTRACTLKQEGDLDAAQVCFVSAQQQALHVGDVHVQAMSLEGLGDVHDLRNRHAEARSCWSAAAELYEVLGAPQRGSLSDRLNAPPVRPGSSVLAHDRSDQCTIDPQGIPGHQPVHATAHRSEHLR